MPRPQAKILFSTHALIFFALILGLGAPPAHAAQEEVRTVAYFEAGPYWEFSLIHERILTALDARGLGNHFEFPEELHISPGWMASKETYQEKARELMSNPSIDAIFSMGTAATKALIAENNGKTLILAIDVADPVGAGIIDPRTKKGPPNMIIKFIKDKWFKVFALFHEALPFEKLGIMYHDSPDGKSYSNLNEAREVARERGFALMEYPYLDKEESLGSCEDGVSALIEQGIDAFYISALNCFDWTQSKPKDMLDALNKNGIKTFARDGTIHVRHGALMGLSTLDYTPLGMFYADRMASELGLLSIDTTLQTKKYTPKVTLNMVTASDLGMDLPLLLLISADEIFDSTLAEIGTMDVAHEFQETLQPIQERQ